MTMDHGKAKKMSTATITGTLKNAIRTGFMALACMAMLGGPVSMAPRPAYASCCEPTTCACMTGVATGLINPHTQLQFQLHELWMVDIFFTQYVLPAMMLMTEQLSAVGMQQMQIVGTFLDAKHLLETQRLFQQLAAQAHKDYHPSEGLCTIGTTVRSLAASDRNGDIVAAVLSQRSIDRQLLNANASSAEGPLSDRDARLRQFRATYCDRNDNNGGLATICEGTVTAARMNKDIDYTRTITNPLTLNANFSDADPTPDEIDVLALASNLYAHDVFRHIPQAALNNKPENQQLYMDMRSVVAKRSVAENSFQAIAAMKAAGATPASETAQYLRAVLVQLGMAEDAAEDIIGENPSYYAQMEILSKKVFQSPQFFIDLYDKPANVARKGVAIQAIGLMQDRDTFKSNLRSEAMLSILLEMELMAEQRRVQNEANRITGTQ